MQTVYLTRRNLLTLLSKLDRAAKGEDTQRTIIKTDIWHPVFPCTDSIKVIALEDKNYYTHRQASLMHPRDEENLRHRK